MTKRSGYILHSYHRNKRGREEIYAIGCLDNGDSFGIIINNLRPHFYIDLENLPLIEDVVSSSNVHIHACPQHSLDGQDLMEVSADNYASLKRARSKIISAELPTYEAELSHHKRWLIDNDIRGAIEIEGTWQNGTTVDHVVYNPHITQSSWEAQCSILAIDIETSYNEHDSDHSHDICTAISLIGNGKKENHNIRHVLILDPDNQLNNSYIQSLANEKMLLETFATQIQRIDPDIITGWNVIDFDFNFLEQRFQHHNIPWTLGRSQDSCAYRKGKRWGSSKMFIPGRQVLDAMHLMRHTLQRYNDYALDTIAQAVLGRGKLLHDSDEHSIVEQIQQSYQQDKKLFADYCLEDAQLVLDILQAENLITLTIQRSSLTGLSLERAWGSVEAFEFLYMSELHKQDIILRSAAEIEHLNDGAPGGYVFQPKVGLYNHIFVFDFKSLYPSIIRTFNIDPLSHAQAQHISPASDKLLSAPNDALFTRQRGILPQLLDVFFDKRAAAKLANDDLASYSYKIVMNSFYGVLGSSSCRLAHPQLAGAITSFGHLLLKWSRDVFESMGHNVLYGDTDSLFVDTHQDINVSAQDADTYAQQLCNEINQRLDQYIHDHYQLDSRLELEFEKHYHKLLLPPSRGDDDIGRAKGYAGLLRKDQSDYIDIVGLEAVRRDWTDLAHTFQRSLFDLLFHDATSSVIEKFIRTEVNSIYQGHKDKELVYRRALRKAVEDYTKTTPPHVKAARLLDNPSGLIEYVMTIQGPQPLEALSAAINYEHYVKKQIEPIVNAVASFCGIDTGRAINGEQRLF
ncbi:MAG: DNA polymerase II [Planctomycetes bacterium]|nr:DNA polymerase II [Planctomycetota bacterium]